MNYPVLVILFITISLPIWYVTGFAASSAELQRPTDVNVDSDLKSVITIIPSEEYSFITVNPELEIGFDYLPAESLNQNSILEVGDQSTPSTDPAFTIQNSSTEQVRLTLSLEEESSYDGSVQDVRYSIEYEENINEIIVGESETFVLYPGESVSISIQITTDQTTTDLSTVFSITGGDTNA